MVIPAALLSIKPERALMLEGLKEPHAADHKQVAKNVLKPLVSTVTGKYTHRYCAAIH